jgi:dephospho-CoA kinase
MAAFGEKAYLLVSAGPRMIGIVGWQVENLVSRTTDVLIDPQVPAGRALPVLIKEMEKASKDLLCEASLVFVGPELAHVDVIWKDLGYRRLLPQDLGVLAWKEAAVESMPIGTMMYFKQLRQDRILRPV